MIGDKIYESESEKEDNDGKAEHEVTEEEVRMKVCNHILVQQGQVEITELLLGIQTII